MKTKLLFTLLVLSLFLFGCQTAEEEQNITREQVIPEYDEEPVIEENITTPSHIPEPVEEQPSSNSRGLLEDHNDSDHFLKSHPAVGETVSPPRKIEVITNYPMTKGTDITLWRKDEETWFNLEDTIVAGEDALVAIAYLKEDLNPGIYKVKYSLVFAGKKPADYNGEGYYYFEVE